MNVTEWFTETNGLVLTSGFGEREYWLNGKLVTDFHRGLDFGGRNVRGKLILCPGAGVVTHAGFNDGGYGHYVGVKMPTDFTQVFAHLDERGVKVGDRIRRGDSIGKLGNTGKSTAPHLHFQINRPGTGVNGSGFFGHPDDYVFEEDDMRTHCVVGNTEVDSPILMPVVQVLRRQDDCPIYFRTTMTKSLNQYRTVYVVGGTEADVRALAPDAEIVLISGGPGTGRLETAVAAQKWVSINK